jgi:hypothetical protein
VGSLYSHSRPFRTDKPLWLDGLFLLVDMDYVFTFRLPFNLGVMDLRGPPLMQANGEKIDALKRCAQEIACDRRSCDDVQISYLETLEERDNDNLRLAQMLAG